MQNKKKGLVAAVAGAALLLAGGTTFALWSDDTTLAGGQAQTGTLSLNASTLDWALVDAAGNRQAISFDGSEYVPAVRVTGYVNEFFATGTPAVMGGNQYVSGERPLYRVTSANNLGGTVGTESYAVRVSLGYFTTGVNAGLPHHRFALVEPQPDGTFSLHSGTTAPLWTQAGVVGGQRTVTPLEVSPAIPAVEAFGFVPGTRIQAQIELSPDASGTGLRAELTGLPLYGGRGTSALGSYFVRVGDDVVGEIRPSVRVIDHANPTAYHPVRYTQQTATWANILLGREAGATFVLELEFVSGQGQPQHVPGTISLDDVTVTLSQLAS